MRVYVTGASGYIGSHVVQSLAADGHEVVGIDNYSLKENFPTPDGVPIHKIDTIRVLGISLLISGSFLILKK